MLIWQPSQVCVPSAHNLLVSTEILEKSLQRVTPPTGCLPEVNGFLKEQQLLGEKKKFAKVSLLNSLLLEKA